MIIKMFVIDPLSRPESTSHHEAMTGRLGRRYTSIRKRPKVEAHNQRNMHKTHAR